MTPILTPVLTPKLLRELWPALRHQVERLEKAEKAGWITDDVYAELSRFDGTYLWTTADLCGFVVVQVLASPYARNLHVWVACNSTGSGVRDFVEQMRGMAVEADCDNVTFTSGRTGWRRVLSEFEPRTTYTLKLGETT